MKTRLPLTALSLALSLAFASTTFGQTDPAAQFRKLTDEFQKAMDDFGKLYGAAKTDKERQRIVNEKYPRADKFAPRFLEFAKQHPDSPTAIDALVWIVSHAHFGKDADKAVSILLVRHIESDKLGQVCETLVASDNPKSEQSLRDIMARNPHLKVQGQATYSLARLLAERGGKGAQDEAERLFNQVVEKFADVKHGRGTLTDAAKADLFELHHLAIGKVAPEIEGEDMDGKRFKLSDYRGKVVVIDFWGDW